MNLEIASTQTTPVPPIPTSPYPARVNRALNHCDCGEHTDFCPLPCCESPEITANSCLDCMDTRNVNGMPVRMCEECCWKFDHPADRTPEFTAWLVSCLPAILTRNYTAQPVGREAEEAGPSTPWVVLQESFRAGVCIDVTNVFVHERTFTQAEATALAYSMNDEAVACGDHIFQHSVDTSESEADFEARVAQDANGTAIDNAVRKYATIAA